MSGTLLLRGARQLLTLRGSAQPRRGAALQELGIIRDGSLLIQDGRIVEVGATRRVENLVQARKAQEIDATAHVVIPGFVDCCARLLSSAPFPGNDETGSPEQQGGLAGLRNTSVRRLESRARHIVDGMIRQGTTLLEAQGGYGLDARGELKVLRVHDRLKRSPLQIVSTFVAAGSAGAAGIDSMRADLLPAICRRTLAHFAAFRCAGEPLPLDEGRLYLEAARALGLQLKIEAGPGTGRDAIRLALEVGAASIARLEGIPPAELEWLAHSNTMAILLPDTTQTARSLIDQGAAVALGSNFDPGSRSTYSMPLIVAMACASQDMTPEEAICAATYNAACATGSSRVAGSLEVGKPANLLLLNASDYREIAGHFGVGLVNRTIKDGVTVYHEGDVQGPRASL